MQCYWHSQSNDTSEINSTVFEWFKKSSSLTMEKGVTQPDELYVSYSPRSNDQLLQCDSFVETSSVCDVNFMPPLR